MPSKSLPKNELLVIVHPGSACGSADDIFGRDIAATQRLEMQLLVEGWEGGVVVIDGHFSDELEGGRGAWEDWGNAIKTALEQAKQKGLVSTRVLGDDSEEYDQHCAMKDVIQEHGLRPASTCFCVTGAWVHDDGEGCVNGIRDLLVSFGFQARVEDAMDFDFESDQDEPEDDADEELADEEPVVFPRRFRR